MSFKTLKKNRKNKIATLQAELEKMNQRPSYSDDRFWYPKRDKSGNAHAIIRFLPAPDGEDFPWVKTFSHGWQGPGGKWYIENCPTTVGGQCPCCEANNELWNTGSEANQNIVRKRKRKLSYVTNILVLKDPAEPDNEGKVFLFKIGKKIFDKITDLMQPEFEDEEPVDPFDFWEGADFVLKVRQVEGYANYDKSSFEAPSALLGGDDAALEGIYKQQTSLQEFVAPDQYKSYEELEKRLKLALGKKVAATTEDTSEPEVGDSKEAEAVDETKDADDTMETMEYFQKLAAEAEA